MAMGTGVLDLLHRMSVGLAAEAAPFAEERAAQEFVAREDSQAEKLRAAKEELAALRLEQGRLHQAIFEAAQVQRRLCAPREFSSGEFEIAGEIFPVRHLSGDFFKVMELGAEIGIVVGDIAGKGLSAGVWLTHLVGLVQSFAKVNADPSVVLAEMNRALCEGYGEPPLTALFFARIDPERGELAYCNAGLPSPLVLRDKASPCALPSDSIERLEKGGPMLGAMRGARFTAGKVTLENGDTLVAYSDGVTECRNAKDEEFNMERLSAAVRGVGGWNANQALFSTLGSVLDFADGCAPADDLTLLVVRRRERIAAGQDITGSRDASLLRHERVSVSGSGGAAERVAIQSS